MLSAFCWYIKLKLSSYFVQPFHSELFQKLVLLQEI